jgi:signal transduction histidine kinase
MGFILVAAAAGTYWMLENRDSAKTAMSSLPWRQIVDAANHTAIVGTDARGRVTSWNSGARQIFGWTEAEMLGQSLGDGLWRIEADINELEAAILNLAVNPRDAMPEGGRLTIETANAHLDEACATAQTEVVAGHYVSISISDTGTGMDADTVAQAFEPFFTTKPVGKGTGLGLSQVYRFAEQSGGHVRIYSEVAQGAAVRLYLPRLLNAASAADPEVQTFVPEAQKDEIVLVVEDDADIRAYSLDVLRDLGIS